MVFEPSLSIFGLQILAMKLRFLLLLTHFIIATATGQGLKRKVLFLGNSYTHYNNLPAMLAAAATSVGDTLVYDLYAPGGYTLAQHLNDNSAINKIKAGGWDYVVLQEQSQRPSFPQYSLADANNLSSKIRQYNPCARPLFYMTWGRKNGDASNCSFWPPLCTYAGMDSMLHMRYLQMAKANHTEVSPVGATWKHIRQHFPGIELYDPDQSHPSVAGTYAGVCSFYASVFKKDPSSILHTAGLSAANAANIRQAAKLVVFDSLANWHFPDQPPKADFHYVSASGANEIQLINKSLRGDSYLWNFGDGDTSTLRNPTHSYPSNGSFLITLTVSRCDLGTVYKDSFQKIISFCAFTPVIFPDTIMLCTVNPDTLWTQPFDAYQWFNADGDSIPNATHRYFVPTLGDNYYVRTRQNGCAEMSSAAFVNSFFSFGFYYVNPVASNPICLGDTVLLILNPVTTPQPADKDVVWFRDGIPVPFSGNDSLLITTSGNYHAVVYDTLYCPGSPIFTTSAVPVEFQNCTVSVSKNRSSSQVSIYPNPGKDFTIRIHPDMIGARFAVTDVLGKIIQTGRFEKELNKVQMEGVKGGIYLLKIGKEAGTVLRLIRE